MTTAAATEVHGPTSVCRVGQRLDYWAVGCGSCCKSETLVLALVLYKDTRNVAVITSGLVLPPQIIGEEHLKMKNTDQHCSCVYSCLCATVSSTAVPSAGLPAWL